MKKLKLAALNLGKLEVLNREQLRQVLGGDDSGSAHSCYGSQTTCTYQESGSGSVTGTCSTNSSGRCACGNGNSSVLLDACVRTA